MATVILIRGGRVMKKIFYFAAFAACVLTSCQQVLDIQEKEEDIKTPGLVFTATTESSATKTALEEDSGNYNVAWRSGDKITIVDAAATQMWEYIQPAATPLLPISLLIPARRLQPPLSRPGILQAYTITVRLRFLLPRNMLKAILPALLCLQAAALPASNSKIWRESSV